MKIQILARRYAEAFFKIASENNLDEIYSGFSAFAELLKQRSDFADYFRNPLVTSEQKMLLLRKSLASGPSILQDFLCLLVKRFRFSLLEAISKEFEHIYLRSRNILEVRVASAVQLTEAEKTRLIGALSKRVSGTVRLSEKVDPSQKGGLLLCYGDHIYDSTVKNRLKILDERMLALARELLAHVEDAPTLTKEGRQS
ncbi:MAG: ATP synthase F1 subunit delta [Candidatus Riflebacteria bacterium]|nr:ATP synthase F1 subunit delta [Candidatus Riflebacteria bacterium]